MDSWKDRKGPERSWVEAIGGLREGGPTEAKYPRTKLHTKKCRNITLKTDPLCVSTTNNNPAFPTKWGVPYM